MVQVDPHCHRHTEANIKSRAVKLVQIRPQQRLSFTGIHDIKGSMGNYVKEGVVLLGSLNQHCVNVTAKKPEVLSSHRILTAGFVLLKPKEVPVEGDAELLKREEKPFQYCMPCFPHTTSRTRKAKIVAMRWIAFMKQLYLPLCKENTTQDSKQKVPFQEGSHPGTNLDTHAHVCKKANLRGCKG